MRCDGSRDDCPIRSRTLEHAATILARHCGRKTLKTQRRLPTLLTTCSMGQEDMQARIKFCERRSQSLNPPDARTRFLGPRSPTLEPPQVLDRNRIARGENGGRDRRGVEFLGTEPPRSLGSETAGRRGKRHAAEVERKSPGPPQGWKRPRFVSHFQVPAAHHVRWLSRRGNLPSGRSPEAPWRSRSRSRHR